MSWRVAIGPFFDGGDAIFHRGVERVHLASVDRLVVLCLEDESILYVELISGQGQEECNRRLAYWSKLSSDRSRRMRSTA